MHLLILLTACDGGTVKLDTAPDDTGGTDTGDTDTGDTDTGDTGDTDTGDTDTGDTDTGEPADLTFLLHGDWSGSTLTLTWLDPMSLGGGELHFGDVLTHQAVTSGTVGVTVGALPAKDLVEFDPVNAPGLKMAVYVPGLHHDDDGDGERSGDELWMGVGTVWPLYLDGPVPQPYEDQGFHEGWNALAFHLDADPTLGDPATIPLGADLLPVEDLTISGTWDRADGPEFHGIFTAPYTLFTGGDPVAAYLSDGVATDPWSIAVHGEPPADHFTTIDGMGIYGDLEIPVAYVDWDVDGEFDSTDTPVAPACVDGVAVALLWYPPTTDLLTGLSLALQELQPGWIPLYMNESGGLVPPDRLADLSIDDSCVL